PKAADFIEREHEGARADYSGQTAQRIDPNRRLLADERQREMNVVERDRTAAAFERDLAREAGNHRAGRLIGPEREKHALRRCRPAKRRETRVPATRRRSTRYR